MSSWLSLDIQAPWPSLEDIRRARVLLVSAPPSQQSETLERLTPALSRGTIVLFQAGKLASIGLRSQADQLGVELGETNTELRLDQHSPVWLSSPTQDTARQALTVLAPSFPNLTLARSPQECAINDPAAVLHPATLLLNLSRVEQMGPYRTRHLDATESVGRVLDALDLERLNLGNSLGWEVAPLATLLGVKASTAYQILRKPIELRSHMSPDSIEHPYFQEEIPFLLAPLVELAAERHVPVPCMQSVVLLAEAAVGRSLKARRSFTVTSETSDVPLSRDFEFPQLGLSEVVTQKEPNRPLSLSHSPPLPTLEQPRPVATSGDIAESFERLREALERKLSRE